MRTVVSSDPVPLAVRTAMVESLYASPGMVLIGGAAGVVLSGMSYLLHGDHLISLWAFVIVAIAALRMLLVVVRRRFGSRVPPSEELAKWETLYMVGSICSQGSIGLLVSLAAIRHPDSAFTFAALATSLGSSLSVGTRNYQSRILVHASITACCFPIIVAFAFNGYMGNNHSSLVLAVVMVFVQALSMSIAGYVRKQFLDALTKSRLYEISSRRFNLAISSMPNGLMLVDGDGRLMVVNAKAAEMLGISPEYDGRLSGVLETAFEADSAAKVVGEFRRVGSAVRTAPAEQLQVETKDGRWLQCEFNDLGSGGHVLTEDIGGKHVGAAVMIIQDITDKVVSNEALREAACFDKLTGLPNRRHWETLVDGRVGSLPASALVAMCILDIDRFKVINDTLGHHIGDEVIAGVAARLLSVADGRMICGRLGGDEFVVLVAGLMAREEVDGLFDIVMSAISTTYEISGHKVDVRCSGGVIVRSGAEFNRPADMSRADMALYKVKKNREQLWKLFDDALETEYEASIRIKHDLKGAIRNGELLVVYQPIFDVGGEVMVGSEALCRWVHPDAGPIPPSQFIAMAEDLGIIGNLTEYVLRTACRDCKAWGADVAVSVNLSALDLARDEILGLIKTALADYELSGDRLCIEVTETVFVKDFVKTAETLRALNEMGVKTSLDDFGTGYSSLSYLSLLPLNRVKIDQAFIADIANDRKAQRLFLGVVSLAKALEFDVVVEGVERHDQLDFVRAVPGVDMIQGHIFSHAFTVEEMVSRQSGRNACQPSSEATMLL